MRDLTIILYYQTIESINQKTRIHPRNSLKNNPNYPYSKRENHKNSLTSIHQYHPKIIAQIIVIEYQAAKVMEK